ncbi:hypothetical protein BT96DRAFT_981976 [Gymnopus androsaceus JB14]|uniref:Uncharacterized protein n=1 Tax=Gymnopus androsaceus JB14 TaxID=1447944 RepID=A0A6A4GJ09_9AGAR|nr:hypothetical protein BT96DRAFT_981976 [Gymnopus androsaceus JB14]
MPSFIYRSFNSDVRNRVQTISCVYNQYTDSQSVMYAYHGVSSYHIPVISHFLYNYAPKWEANYVIDVRLYRVVNVFQCKEITANIVVDCDPTRINLPTWLQALDIDRRSTVILEHLQKQALAVIMHVERTFECPGLVDGVEGERDAMHFDFVIQMPLFEPKPLSGGSVGAGKQHHILPVTDMAQISDLTKVPIKQRIGKALHRMTGIILFLLFILIVFSPFIISVTLSETIWK